MIRKGNSIINEPIKRILLIQLGDIGDIVLSFPCARAIRERYPKAHIAMAVRPKAGDLLTCCPFIDETIWVDDQKRPFFQAIESQFYFFRRLRSGKFDLAIDLRTGTRGALLACLSGAPRRLGFFAAGEPFWRNWLFTDLASPYEPENNHIAYFYAGLLKEFGIATSHPWPEMHTPLDIAAKIAQRLNAIRFDAASCLVVIQPFSLWRYKEFGDEKIIELCQRISSQIKAIVIIVGSGAERERAEAMAVKSQGRVVSWAGQTTLAELTGLIARADLFIGVDSAGMHIAAAVGTATVTIFGPSSPKDWAPRGKIHTTVTPDWPCTPCFQKGCRNSGRSDCLLRMPVERVLDPVLRWLGTSRNKSKSTAN